MQARLPEKQIVRIAGFTQTILNKSSWQYCDSANYWKWSLQGTFYIDIYVCYVDQFCTGIK
jgi:hypothetical protein